MTTNAYDERDLQRKALAQWERQREVWQRMQQALEAKRTAAATATTTMKKRPMHAATAGAAGKQHGVRTLLATSTWCARERNEDLSLLQLAVPRSALSSHRVWESTLRGGDDDACAACQERCVQVGKGYYPYALFSKVRDAAALPASSVSLARVVSDVHDKDDDDDDKGNKKATATATTDEAQRHGGSRHGPVDDDDGGGDMAIASVKAARRRCRAHATVLQQRQRQSRLRSTQDKDDNVDNNDNDDVDDYYARQLQLFAPYVQRRLPHFLLPRSFLCVHGQPAPRVYTHGGNASRGDDDAVAFVAPLPPRMLYAHATTAAGDKDDGDGDEAARVAAAAAATSSPSATSSRHTSTSAAPSTHAYVTHTAPPSPRACNIEDDEDDDDDVAGENDDDDNDGVVVATAASSSSHAARGVRVAPRVVLSSRQLLFRGVPHELVHGHVDVSNTSAMTVYYSWRSLPLVDDDEDDDEDDDSEDGNHIASQDAHATADGDNHIDDDDDASARERLRVLRRVLHARAHYARRARHFVHLVSGVNGVLLPHSTRRFAFALRAPHAGVVCHAVELLTVPSCARRVVLRLCAIVQSADAPAAVVAAHVERALHTRAMADAQRQLLQQLVRAAAPYDAADVDAAMTRLRAQRDAAAAARARDVAAQRAAWCRANGETFDRLPYNVVVYAQLSRLHDNLAVTMRTLQQQQQQQQRASEDKTMTRDTTAASVSPAPWDGSIARLLGDVCELRDAAARNTLLTAMTALLRLARVSTHAEDDMAVLLRRAALALVLQHDQHSLMLQSAEVEAVQCVAVTRAAAARATGHASSGAAGGGGASSSGGGGGGGAATAASTSSAVRKSRSTSLVGSRQKQGANNNNSSSGAAGDAAAAAAVGALASSALLQPSLQQHNFVTLAATLCNSNNNSSGGATDASTPRLTGLQLTSDDMAALQREHDVVLARRIAAVTATRPARVDAYAALLRDAIEAGCALPLLDVVHAWRADDVAVVQAADEMDVDTTSAGILPTKPTKRR